MTGPSGRLPDYLIIGARKAGTSTLHEWLGEQPEVVIPATKEPNFFGDPEVWARGLDWYRDVFAAVPDDALTGEASVRYTSREWSATAAARVAQSLPAVRVVYVVREPLERARSHFRHEVQKHRERRPFVEAISDVESPYVAESLYAQRLAPWLEHLGADRVCVVRFEDLVGPGNPGWHRILEHLGLTPRAAPGTAYNVTAEKGQYTGLMLRSWERGWLRGTGRLPGFVRRLGKRVLVRDTRRYRERLADADQPLPDPVVERIRADTERLREMVGPDRVGWPEPLPG